MSASVMRQPQQRIDVTTRIARTMRQMGISGIPRNYELIYEACTGCNPELAREIGALGANPGQEELDRIGKKYLAHRHGETVVDNAHRQVSYQLESILALLRQEQSSLEGYSRVLAEAYGRISAKSAASSDLLTNAISLLTEATGSTMAEGKQIAASVGERSNEMAKVRHELDEYKRIANTDPLTRLANRRAFDEAMGQIYATAESANYYALMLVDIDHFKRVNDTFGHPVGDRVLAIVANIMRRSLRSDVFIARTGGEEFAIVLRDVSHETVLAIAERLRTAVESTPLRNQKTGTEYGPITVSVGACMGRQADNADELYQKVDMALYTAKAAGRNRVEMYREDMENGSLSDRFLYRRGIA